MIFMSVRTQKYDFSVNSYSGVHTIGCYRSATAGVVVKNSQYILLRIYVTFVLFRLCHKIHYLSSAHTLRSFTMTKIFKWVYLLVMVFVCIVFSMCGFWYLMLRLIHRLSPCFHSNSVTVDCRNPYLFDFW